jgi:hypothetical protein
MKNTVRVWWSNTTQGLQQTGFTDFLQCFIAGRSVSPAPTLLYLEEKGQSCAGQAKPADQLQI